MFVSNVVQNTYEPTLRAIFRNEREFTWEWFSTQSSSFQSRVLKDAERFKPHVDDNPMFAWIPHAKQRLFLGASTPIRAFIGGNRSGKTTAGIADLLIQACDRDCLPEDLQAFKRYDPPFYCRIITPDLQRTSEGVIMQKLREMCPRSQLVGESWIKGYEKAKRTLHFKNGSWIDMSLSYETDLDKFGGTALHAVYYDEEPSGPNAEAIRSECQMRLIDYNGEEIFMMTPLLGMSMVYDTVWEPASHNEVEPGMFQAKDITVVQVDMDENPHLPPEAKERLLAGLTKEERAARKSGRFIHFSGLVYDEFDNDTHVVDPITPDHLKGQTIFVGIDPGISTTAVVLACFDRDNHMLVFDELYLGETSAIPENVVRVIKQKEREWNIQPAYYLIDPSARNRQLTDADRVQAAYFRAGISTVPAQNDLEAGVFEVKRRLQHKLLLVTRNCQQWLWERGRYRIQPREDGKFAVITRQNHLMDATRYVAMARPIAEQIMKTTHRGVRGWVHGTAPPWRDTPQDNYGPLGIGA